MHKPVDIEYCLKVAVGLIASPIPPRTRHKPISLANYDVSFVNNAVRSINAGDGMSDRQRELSVKLVSKYTKQFRKLGIDVTDIVQNPVFSSNLRQVDRTKLLTANDKTIYVKFPYSKKLIGEFKSLSKKLRTKSCEWVKESRMYELDYNEYNLLQLYNWGSAHKFKFSETVITLIEQFKEILNNRNKYAIQLVVTNTGCSINNAPETLLDWWTSNMSSESVMSQIVKAADQNIDVINKSTTIKIGNIANRMLNDRGGKFTYDECSLVEIVNSARELEFKRIAYIVDGRNIAQEQKTNILDAINIVGNDKCSVMLKYIDENFNTNKRLNDNVEFAILDSTQRYNHPKSQTSWQPDFVISGNTFTKFRNIFAESTNSKKPWVCYYAHYKEEINLEV